jgi:hypothetical protein
MCYIIEADIHTSVALDSCNRRLPLCHSHCNTLVYIDGPLVVLLLLWVVLLLALGIYGAITYVVRGSTTCNAHVTVCKLW